jgi:signal transduction histidine kinase
MEDREMVDSLADFASPTRTTEGPAGDGATPQSDRGDTSAATPDYAAELAHRERQIAALRSVSEGLFDHLSVEQLVRGVLRAAIEVLQADVGSVQLYDPQTDRLVFRYVQDPKAQQLIGHSIPTSQGISGKVFRTGLSNLTHTAKEQPEFNGSVDKLTGYATESMLTVALKRFGGEPLGVIQILNGNRQFDQRDLEVLEVLSGQAATSLETARLVQRARRAEIVDIIADISHDLKNMLVPIKTGTQTLGLVFDGLCTAIESACHGGEPDHLVRQAVERALTQARRDFCWLLGSALESADRMVARTKEIVDAAHGETAPFVVQEADLNESVASVVEGLALLTKGAKVELRLALDPSLPPVEFEPRQMHNALFNLVYNAVEASPAGGAVTLRTRYCPDHPDEVVVEVEDAGHGMPAHVRERAFTEEAITTKQGGTGLGTRIVASVVRRHAGSLAVDSEEGRGTTVSIRLPTTQPSDSPPASGC